MNPAQHLKKSKNNIAITKLQPTEAAIAYLVAYKSEIQLANLLLKNDILMSLPAF